MPRTRRPRRPNISGALSRNYPRTKRWRVDFDYLRRLSPEEIEWLHAFCNNHYGGNFSYAGPEGYEAWSKDERRKAYAATNAANRDLYSTCPEESVKYLGVNKFGRAHLDEPWSTDDVDFNPYAYGAAAPAYLESPEYRDALADYRAEVDRLRKSDPPSEALLKAKRRLERITGVYPHGPADES